MKNKHFIQGVIIEKNDALNLEEFSLAIKADKKFVIELVEYHLINPEGENPEEWRFDSLSLRKGRIAVSFYHDLEVNMPGIALALDLLEKIENFQNQLNILKRRSH